MFFTIINEMYKGNFSFGIFVTQILIGVVQIIIQIKKRRD